MTAVLRNLDRYFEALEQGAKPKQIQGGFVHPEPEDVVAVDQKGGGAGLSQTRLYLFADVQTEELHLITLGGKDTQEGDIKFSKTYAKKLKQEKVEDPNNVHSKKRKEQEGQKERGEE